VGVAALVLGIIGTLFSLFPGTFIIGCLLGLVALILGIVGRKSLATAGQPTGVATAGLVLGIVALVVGVLMFILCGMIIKQGIENAKNPQSWRPQGRPLTGEVLKVSPKQLLADYTANEVAADLKYKGKTLEVTGPIESISKDFLDEVYVAIEAGDPIRTVTCYLDSDSAKKVATLTKGQTVTVQGRGDGLLMNVVLRDSVLK
jgi:hypothetical protein